MIKQYLSILVFITCASAISAKQTQPNVVFVFSDQQSFDMLGCYGNKQIITPNIDKLAAGGIRFEYCISNTPVCSPYRGMLMTGQHPLYNGVYKNDNRLLTNNGITFAQALKGAGYSTAYFGKWHLYGGDRNRNVPAGPDRLGFDVFSTNNCTLNFSPEAAYYYNEDGKKVQFNEWEAYGQTRQAVEYLNSLDDAKPFALFVSFHPPHDQGGQRDNPRRYKTIPELMEMYERDRIALRPTALESPGPDGTTLDELKEDYHGYYSMCTGVDQCVGEIVKALSEKGEMENTIFVYTSDHGDNLKSNARPWAKSTPDDYSVRVPLIIHWPEGLINPQVSNLLVGTLDLMPTILSLAGVGVPDSCQGTNLAPAISGKQEMQIESVPLFYFMPNWRGVFTERYTFSFDTYEEKNSQTWNVLYDRWSDPLQQHNLFYHPKYKAVRDALFQETLKWMAHYNDPMVSERDLLRISGLKSAKTSTGENGGVLPGRPIDLIIESNLDSLIPESLPGAEQTKALLERIRDREIRRIEGVYQEKINKLDGIDEIKEIP